MTYYAITVMHRPPETSKHRILCNGVSINVLMDYLFLNQLKKVHNLKVNKTI